MKNKAAALFMALLLLRGCCAGPLAHASDLLTIARAEIGRGESGGNNKGGGVKKYTRGQEVAWCAAFVSYCLRQSGRIRDDRYLLSARSYWTAYADFRVRGRPEPEDIIVFYRGRPQSGRGHVGIVEAVDGASITTIEGNVGKYPARVKRCHYRLGKIPKLIGFVRIPS